MGAGHLSHAQMHGADSVWCSPQHPCCLMHSLGSRRHDLSSFQSGLVVSSSLLGALGGSAAAFWVGDKLGRKRELLLASVLYGELLATKAASRLQTAAWLRRQEPRDMQHWHVRMWSCPALTIGTSALLMAGAPNLELLLLGRTLYGLGIGFAMHAAPAFIAEAAPARVRGLLIRHAPSSPRISACCSASQSLCGARAGAPPGGMLCADDCADLWCAQPQGDVHSGGNPAGLPHLLPLC